MKIWKLLLILIAVILFSITGCSKTTDIEDRNYLMVLGLDKKEDQLEATFSFANLSQIADTPGGEELSDIFSITGSSIREIQEKYKTFNDKKLETGHLKSIIFGSELMMDEELKTRVLQEIESSTEYTRTVQCYMAEASAKGMVEMDNEISGLLSDYLNNIYNNNMQRQHERPVTLEHMLKSLNEGEVIAVPNLASDHEKPAVTSYTIVTAGMPGNRLSVAEYQLYLLLLGKVPYQGVKVNQTEISFITVKSRGHDPLKLKGTIKAGAEADEDEINRSLEEILARQYSFVYGEEIEVEADFIVQ